MSLLLLLVGTAAFSYPQRHSVRPSSRLYGLLEWREVQSSKVSPLLLLPYHESNILLPGQASQVVLKEGRHFDMVEDALEGYQSMIGQAVMGEDKLASIVSLCHITDTDVNSGYRGKITMTISLEAVGRATLEELLALKPVPQGFCSELRENWDNQEMDALLSLQNQVESVLLELDALSPNQSTNVFQKRYQGALQALGRLKNAETTDQDRIEASSWAVFAALASMEESFEPRTALESATVLDRLVYGLERASELRDTKQRQADRYSLLDGGAFE